MVNVQSINEKRKKERERQKRRRAALKKANAPQTHAVERAAAETLGFLLKKWATEFEEEQTKGLLFDVFSTLEAILVDRLGYDRAETRKALKRLIRPRPAHFRPDFIPSLKSRDS